MSDDEEISRYLRRVRSALRLPRGQRRRAVEEIRNHLDDGAAVYMRDGATREQAIGLAISDLGQADTVAAGFSDSGARGSEGSGVVRWLPLVLPLVLVVVRVGFLVGSAVWFAGGWTTGGSIVSGAGSIT